MNAVQLIGRLTRDPEVRYTNSENPVAIARFSLAVDRRFSRNNEQTADFISCVAFGKTAEHIEKYWNKGMKMAATGRIQTGSYTKDGQKVYTTDVVVEQVEFCESKGQQTAPAKGNSQQSNDPLDGFMSIPDGIDEELPFN